VAIRIGTAEPNSTFLRQGRALKIVLERNPILSPIELGISVHASMDNANRLAAGEIDFGFMAANWIGRAKNGEPPFAENIDLRMVAPMNAGPLFFIARGDSGLRTVADLRGRRLIVGARQSGMAEHAQVILTALGLSFDDVEAVYLDFAAGAEALVHGTVEAQLQCPIPNSVMSALAERIDIRVLAYRAGELERVLGEVPLYRRAIMRAGALRGLDADVEQPGVVNVLVTHARAAEEKVRAVAGAIFAAREELPRLEALFAGIGELFEPLRSGGAPALEFGGVALHPGALAAYRSAGLLSHPGRD
jgi:TRAP transporter TAXI family solute receptor